jgi:hypothetical protein
MPRRVKNDRSLLVQIARTARRRASERGMRQDKRNGRNRNRNRNSVNSER